MSVWYISFLVIGFFTNYLAYKPIVSKTVLNGRDTRGLPSSSCILIIIIMTQENVNNYYEKLFDIILIGASLSEPHIDHDNVLMY